MADGLIAIDWGTTNRRGFVLDGGGAVVARFADDRGVLALAVDAYPAEIARLRAAHGALPILAAGMIGSTRGWREAAYVDPPAGLDELAAALLRLPGEDVAIVPGIALRHGSHADVMRGEEVQVLGAVAAGLVPNDALVCQPGTHNKWVRVEQGRIVDFRTALTGELFALLRDHSILAPLLGAPVAPGAAFDAGVATAHAGDGLLTELFGVRARVLLERLAESEAAAFASGLVIGSDVVQRGVAGARVHVLADGVLGALYASAIVTLGGEAEIVPAGAGFAAGIQRIAELAR